MARQYQPVRDRGLWTSGDVAAATGLSINSIIRAIDTRHLKGFRIPGSRFRKVPVEAVREFMRSNGIPVSATAPRHLREALEGAEAEVREAVLVGGR